MCKRSSFKAGTILKDFVYVNSWFEKKYKKDLSDRYFTFKAAFNLFLQRKGKVIVETGTQRMEDDWGGGCSTSLFGEFCQKYDGHLWTCDIDENNLNVARKVTKKYEDNIDYVLSDSHIFLKEFNLPIDFLYLDSVDVPLEGTPADYPQQHQLIEFKLIEPMLHEKTIVLLDDNNFDNGGKPKYTKEYLIKQGWECILDYQQTLWIRK